MKNRAHLSVVSALVLAFSFVAFSGLHAAPLQGNKSAEQTDKKKTEQKSAAATPDQRQMRDLDEQVQQTKSDVLSIAAELNQLEEKLLYPSGTQVAIFVALAKGDELRLDAVRLQIDGQLVCTTSIAPRSLRHCERVACNGSTSAMWPRETTSSTCLLTASLRAARTSTAQSISRSIRKLSQSWWS